MNATGMRLITQSVYETSYRHDRRRHRHRCRCCARIINEGEAVIQARVSNSTYSIHEACGDKQHGDAAWTWRDAMTEWAKQR
jgi:hypothetical protein